MEFTGHLIVEQLDTNGNILDRFEDHNKIMRTAHVNMAQLLCGRAEGSMINKIVIGTMGHYINLMNAIDENTLGFVSERTRLFSEAMTLHDGDVVQGVLVGDLFLYNGAAEGGEGVNEFATKGSYYQRLNTNMSNSLIASSEMFNDQSLWRELAIPPYTYTINFANPDGYQNTDVTVTDGTVTSTIFTNAAVSNTDGIDPENTNVKFVQNDTHAYVVYTFFYDVAAANNINGTEYKGETHLQSIVPYTEAALYADDLLFSMRTFPAKIKSETTTLKIIWRINF
jgi:hypothetical protein